MTKLKQYKKILTEVFTYQSTLHFSNAPEVEQQLIINKDETQFLVMVIGWIEEEYKHFTLLHAQLKDDKVWLHQNNTDEDIGAVLEKKGIPKLEIVIGFLTPFERALSDYAVV